MVGFSPFGSPDLPWGAKLPHILADPGLAAIAARHARTPAQASSGIGSLKLSAG